MRTHTITTYQYDELTPEAKARARDWYRDGEGEDTSWAEYVIEDAVEVGKLLGIEFDYVPVRLMGGGTRQEPVIYWALHVQGAGASFTGRYAYAKGCAKRIREAPMRRHRSSAPTRRTERTPIRRCQTYCATTDTGSIASSISNGTPARRMPTWRT